MIFSVHSGLNACGRFVIRRLPRLFALIALSVRLFAATSTLDDSGGKDYTTWDALIDDIQSNAVNPDTILISAGSYTWTSNLTVNIGITNLFIIGEETDPDNFPVLNHSGSSDWANAILYTNFTWERITFTGSNMIQMNDPATTLTVRKCVIRDYTTACWLKIAGTSGGTAIIENCLFENNANVFEVNGWGPTTAKVINCTFDGNTTVWDQDESLISTWVFRNNIYVNNTTTFPGNNLRGIATYAHTDEICTNYGVGCFSDPDPEFSTGTRTNPTDWDLANPSSARNIGLLSGAPTEDITGAARTALPDAGAFEGAKDTIPLLILPDSGGQDDQALNIQFLLPMEPENGSVKLTFDEISGNSDDDNDPHIVTLTTTSKGTKTFTLDGLDLSENSNVSAVSSGANDFLVDDAVYDVILQYDTNAVTYADTSFDWTFQNGGGASTLPLNDGFESGLGNWTTSGTVTWDATDSRTGTYCGKMAGTAANLYASVDLSGYLDATDIRFDVYFRDDGVMAATDCFYLDVYDGSWHNGIYSKCDDQDAYLIIRIDIDSLNTINSYNYSTDYRVRFRVANDGVGADTWVVDDVAWTGTWTIEKPQLNQPEEDDYENASFTVSFYLPYTGQTPNLTKIIFDEIDGGTNDGSDPHTLTLHDNLATKGSHTFTLDPTDLDAGSEVTSTNGSLVLGTTYDVILQYDTVTTYYDTVLNFHYANTPSPDNYATWSNKYALRFNTTSTGANVSGTVTNFPVLVRMTGSSKPSTNFFNSETQTGGADIRFAKTTDITHHFPYEIEYWVNGAGDLDTAFIWVLVDSVKGNSIQSYMTMYWGKSIADSSNGKWVFAGSNDFEGVWHLNDDAANTTVIDATGSHNGAYNTDNTNTKDQDGNIAGALDFNGTDDFVTVADHDDWDADDGITLSAWVRNEDAGGEWRGAAAKARDNATDDYWIGLWRDNSATGKWAYRSGAQNSSGSNATVNGWDHIAITIVRGGAITGYLNGSSDWTATNISGEPLNSSEPIYFGRSYNSGEYFDGRIDEVRWSSTVRSADWMKLCYQNQKSSDALISLPGYTPTLTTPATSATDDQDFDIAFSLPQPADAGSVKITFTETGGTGDANDPHILTLASGLEQAQAYSFTLSGFNLSGHANITSVNTEPNDFLSDGTFYSVKIEYQNSATTYSATNTGITYNITAGPSATLPFFESFESGLGGWAATGVTQSTAAPKVGTYNAQLDNPNSSMDTIIDLSPYVGATDILMSWWWKDDGAAFENTDSLLVDIDHDNNGTWYTSVYNESDAPTTLTRRTLDLDALGYTFTSAYRIRFRVVSDGMTEEANIDSIFINGTLPLKKPILNHPEASTADTGRFTLNFYLPYAAVAGTLKAHFNEIAGDADDGDHALTLDDLLTPSGVHSVTINGADLVGSDSVVSVSPAGNLKAGCTYDVIIEMVYSSTTLRDTSVNWTWQGNNISWGASGLGTISGGAIRDSAIYIGAGGSADSLYKIRLSDGAKIWSYYTGAYGDCGAPTFNWTGSYYQLFFAAGSYVLGRQDNGASSSELFSPINVGSAPGTPYTSPDDTSFFYAYSNTLVRKSRTTGANMTGFPKTVTGISTSTDIVTTNDEVFFARSDSVCKVDFDGTDLACAHVSATVSLPLLIRGSEVFVTPADDSLHALNITTLSRKWATPADLNGNSNSGPAFTDDGTSIYVATGNYVKKVTDNGATATVAWTSPDLGAAVNSGPIVSGSYVYVGRSSGQYKVLLNSNGTEYTSNWPYYGPTGNASAGPWISPDYSRVIFGSSGGNLDAFPLE